MKKPHITRRNGLWVTELDGEEIFGDDTLDGAFLSARIVWDFQ